MLCGPIPSSGTPPPWLVGKQIQCLAAHELWGEETCAKGWQEPLSFPTELAVVCGLGVTADSRGLQRVGRLLGPCPAHVAKEASAELMEVNSQPPKHQRGEDRLHQPHLSAPPQEGVHPRIQGHGAVRRSCSYTRFPDSALKWGHELGREGRPGSPPTSATLLLCLCRQDAATWQLLR